MGAFAGIFGELYILAKIGILLNDNSKINFVNSRIHNVLSDIKKDVKSCDIINGYAGILGINAFFMEEFGNKKLINECENIVEKIYEMSYCIPDKRGITWDKGATSYAHGNAGIAAQLYRYYLLGKNNLAKKIVENSIAFDRNLIDEKSRLWFKSANDSTIICTWCNGEAGVLLGRLMLKDMGYEDNNIDREIDVLINCLVEKGFGNDYALCHGDLGNLAILKYAADVKRDIKLKEYCKYTLLEFLNKFYNIEDFETELNLGMMTGLAGIGISILDDYNNTNNICRIFGLK